jgi:hypothetical protein
MMRFIRFLSSFIFSVGIACGLYWLLDNVVAVWLVSNNYRSWPEQIPTSLSIVVWLTVTIMLIRAHARLWMIRWARNRFLGR